MCQVNRMTHVVNVPLFRILLTMTFMPAFVQNAARAASPNGWDASLFAYERPEPLAVEVTTPTPQQVAWFGRPPEMSQKAATALVEPTEGDVKPRTVGPVDVLHLKFRDLDGDVVPALLCTPKGRKGPFPLVV